MENVKQQKINLFQAREFGEIFSAGIKFLKQNFVPLFKCLLFISGPFFLIGTILNIYYQITINNDILNGNYVYSSGLGYLSKIFNWKYFTALFFRAIAGLSLVGVTFSYLVEYHKNGPGNVVMNNVAKLFFKNLGKIIGGSLLVLFLFIIIGFAIGFLIVLISEAGTGIAILMGILTIIGLIIILPPYIFQISTFYLPMIHHEDSVINSLTHIRTVMKGEFWWTWLVVVCNYIIVIVITLVFMIPQLIYTIAATLTGGATALSSNTYVIITNTFAFLVSFVYAIFHLINAFHYYSLSEKKEGIGLMERINEIGSSNNNNNNNEGLQY